MCDMAEEFIRPDDPPSEDEEITLLEEALEDGRHLPPVVQVEEQPPPFGRSWAFNFVDGPGFVTVPGAQGPAQTFGIDTLTMWCEKALRTARGAHPIYPSDYGLRNANRWTGRHLSSADYAEIRADIHEALTFHPRIADVTDFEFDQDPDDTVLEVDFSIVLDDDTTTRLDSVTVGTD